MTSEPRQEKESTTERIPVSALDQPTIERIVEDATPPIPEITENSRNAEKVSAIMVIDQQPRVRLARVAVESFMRQTYMERQLVIVNGSGEKVTTREHPMITEVEVMAGPTIGALRNVGIEKGDGSWFVIWDDDDWSHPHRLAFQMAYRVPATCCVLRFQSRCDVLRSFVVPIENTNGIPGTIMWPKGEARFSEMPDVREDVDFFEKNFGDRRVVVNNNSSWFPGPVLHTAFFHGNNRLSEEDFFGKEWAGKEHQGKWMVQPDEREYLKTILGFYGMSASDNTDAGTAEYASELASRRDKALAEQAAKSGEGQAANSGEKVTP